MYCRLIDGSLVTLSKAKYARTDPQVLSTHHVPLTDLNGAIPLGLDWQTWTISGVIADPQSIRWHDIIWLSLDNVSWRACRVQATAFPTNNYQQSTYELTVLVSPILEGAAVRYPTTGYKFGLQSITGISQAGNVSAFPTIHFLAPLFYAPLSNTLIDFAGQAVTFVRTASKVHAGVTYPINTPIFDNGLYIGSDTSQDFAMWTPSASTVCTVAMQIKQTRYPNPWKIGGTGGNLLTANQSNAETNTTGVVGNVGTLTRNTTTPLAGAGDFKLVSRGGDTYLYVDPAATVVTAGRWYNFQVLIRTNVSGRNARIDFVWFNGATYLSTSSGVAVAVPYTPSQLSRTGQAPATATRCGIAVYLLASGANETLYTDSLMLEAIPDTLSIWTDWSVGHNNIRIDMVNNLIRWGDGTTTVSAVFPTAAYLSGAVTDIVLIDDTSHAVTVAVHAAGGSWTSATGTLALLLWIAPFFQLGQYGDGVNATPLEGSIANLVQYPYVLTSAEYQALAFSSLSLLFNNLFNYLYIGNRYAGEIIKGSDKRLTNANGSDISALLGGTDIPIGSVPVTFSQSQGLSARWYVELKRTDV